MITVFVRTCIIYAVLILSMRLMGKRQIGELEISDLVTTILISEIASLPITNTSIPISHALIPTAALLSFEVISSMLIAKFPRVKNILTARPSVLIKKGSFCKKAMLDARISIDELIGELRQQGISDPAEVLYAILEQNGKITVIPKAMHSAPTAKQLGLEPPEKGLYHIIIDRGCINKHAMSEFGNFSDKIKRYMEKRKIEPRDIYLMMINDVGDLRVILKEDIK